MPARIAKVSPPSERESRARTDAPERGERGSREQERRGDADEKERVGHRDGEQIADRHALLHAPRSTELAMERVAEPRDEERDRTAVEPPASGELRRSAAELRRTEDRRGITRQCPDQERDRQRDDCRERERCGDAHERANPPALHGGAALNVQRSNSVK